MKLKSTLILFSVIFITNSFLAQNKTYGKISYEKAVNLSGKQRMLSQKIAKVKVLKSVGASTADLKAEFSSSMTIFARNLKILDLNSRDQGSKVKAVLRSEKSEWDRFKLIMEKPNPDVQDVLSSAESLLIASHKVVMAIEEESKFSKQLAIASGDKQVKVQTVNIAGKQRMLSQKLCLYYAACRAFKKGKNADTACNKYKNIYVSMDSIVNELMVSELNTSEIDVTISQILGVMDTDLNSQKKAFFDNKVPLQKVVETTSKLLELFNKLTGQYAI